MNELNIILNALNTHNIPVIVLKGAYLAKTVYSQINLREMLDIDLLFCKDRVEEASQILQNLGYSFLYAHQAQLETEQNYSHQLSPMRKSRNLPAVDIHWTICNPDEAYHFSIRELWQSSQTETFFGETALVPSPEDLILHICHHASYHHTLDIGLRSILDLAMIIEHFKHSLDWEILQARTEKWGWQRGVCLMLAMTRQLLEIDLPDNILIWIKNNLVNTNIQVIAQRILLENQQNSKLATLSLTIFSSDLSLIQRIKLSTQRIFLSSAIMSQTYAMSFSYFSPKLYFYYLIRIRDYLIYLRNLWLRYQPVITNIEKTNLDFLLFREEKYLLHRWLQEKSE